MLRLTTIKETYFSATMRFTILESNFTINGKSVIAYLRIYDGKKIDLTRFYFDIEKTPFPFSFKISDPKKVVDRIREVNGLITLRSLLERENQDSDLANNFILESKTFFLTFNN